MLRCLGLLLAYVGLMGCAGHLPAAHTAMAASYPEGPVMTPDGLLFVEFSRDRIMRWRDGQAAAVWHRAGCGPAGLAALPDGSLWVACHTQHRLLRVRPGASGRVLQSHDIPYPNDIAMDAHGGLYVTASGAFDAQAPVAGAVYYIDAAGNMARVAMDIHYSNGIALSHDGTQLHVSEHLRNRLRKYRVRSPGRLASVYTVHELDGRVAHPDSVDPSLLGPDGLGVDARGDVWVAQYAGARLIRVSSGGETVGSVSFDPPFVNVTNVVAHADGRLFVTLVSDDAAGGYPGAVAVLRAGALSGGHVRCRVRVPWVSCTP